MEHQRFSRIIIIPSCANNQAHIHNNSNCIFTWQFFVARILVRNASELKIFNSICKSLQMQVYRVGKKEEKRSSRSCIKHALHITKDELFFFGTIMKNGCFKVYEILQSLLTLIWHLKMIVLRKSKRTSSCNSKCKVSSRS